MRAVRRTVSLPGRSRVRLVLVSAVEGSVNRRHVVSTYCRASDAAPVKPNFKSGLAKIIIFGEYKYGVNNFLKSV